MVCQQINGRWLLCGLLAALTWARPMLADEPTEPKDALARLSGVIRWVDGRPLVQPEVKLHRWSEDGERWQPAEKVAEVDANGKFLFDNLPGDQYWCVVVRVPEAGLALRQIVIEAGKTANVNVTLKPAVAGYVTVRDEHGQPLAGAKFRSCGIVDGNEGTFFLLRGNEAALGLPVSESDDSGRLFLPELPEGAVLESCGIDHSRHAEATLKQKSALQAGEIAACELPAGFPLRFQFVDPESAAPPSRLSEVQVLLYGNLHSRDAVAVMGVPFPVREGRTEFHMQPGEFNIFRVKSASHYMTPRLLTKDNERLRIAAGEYDQWTFRALPKVLVHGRVMKEDGTPVAKAYVIGEIENLLADGTAAPKAWGEWASTEWRVTDAQGEYEVHLAPGRGRISYQGEGLPAMENTPVVIAGRDEQRAPDIVVRDLPKIRGTVIGLDGQPAQKVLVRVHSDSSMRHHVQPVLTDGQGRFEFALTYMLYDTKTEQRVYEHQVFAYSPYESLGGVTTIDLRDENSVDDVTIRMTEQPVTWPLSEMKVAFMPWERGEPDEIQRQERIKPENAIGIAVPDLDGILWLNSDKRSLADFRGQFVFLDFYTTWCGPCARDFPTVKMVHDLYRERGVTVIGVHDNSSAHDAIREHAAEKGMEMPIVIDHEDGRILKAYEALWLASGYPSYVLLDPEGRLISSDRCTPCPTLRNYKVERVRQLLLQRLTY